MEGQMAQFLQFCLDLGMAVLYIYAILFIIIGIGILPGAYLYIKVIIPYIEKHLK